MLLIPDVTDTGRHPLAQSRFLDAAAGDGHDARPIEDLCPELRQRSGIVLAPMAIREILYHLLSGAQGEVLRSMALRDGRSQRVNRALRFAKPEAVERVIFHAGR